MTVTHTKDLGALLAANGWNGSQFTDVNADTTNFSETVTKTMEKPSDAREEQDRDPQAEQDAMAVINAAVEAINAAVASNHGNKGADQITALSTLSTYRNDLLSGSISPQMVMAAAADVKSLGANGWNEDSAKEFRHAMAERVQKTRKVRELRRLEEEAVAQRDELVNSLAENGYLHTAALIEHNLFVGQLSGSIEAFENAVTAYEDAVNNGTHGEIAQAQQKLHDAITQRYTDSTAVSAYDAIAASTAHHVMLTEIGVSEEVLQEVGPVLTEKSVEELRDRNVLNETQLVELEALVDQSKRAEERTEAALDALIESHIELSERASEKASAEQQVTTEREVVEPTTAEQGTAQQAAAEPGRQTPRDDVNEREAPNPLREARKEYIQSEQKAADAVIKEVETQQREAGASEERVQRTREELMQLRAERLEAARERWNARMERYGYKSRSRDERPRRDRDGEEASNEIRSTREERWARRDDSSERRGRDEEEVGEEPDGRSAQRDTREGRRENGERRWTRRDDGSKRSGRDEEEVGEEPDGRSARRDKPEGRRERGEEVEQRYAYSRNSGHYRRNDRARDDEERGGSRRDYRRGAAVEERRAEGPAVKDPAMAAALAQAKMQGVTGQDLKPKQADGQAVDSGIGKETEVAQSNSVEKAAEASEAVKTV